MTYTISKIDVKYLALGGIESIDSDSLMIELIHFALCPVYANK